MEFNEVVKQMKFTSAHWVLLLPVILMAFDVATGLINAWATGHLKSFKMREGLNRKAGEIAILTIGKLFIVAFQVTDLILVGVSFYVILMELISISENLDKMGVKIPKFIKKGLRNAEYKIQEADPTKKEKEGAGDESKRE